MVGLHHWIYCQHSKLKLKQKAKTYSFMSMNQVTDRTESQRVCSCSTALQHCTVIGIALFLRDLMHLPYYFNLGRLTIGGLRSTIVHNLSYIFTYYNFHYALFKEQFFNKLILPLVFANNCKNCILLPNRTHFGWFQSSVKQTSSYVMLTSALYVSGSVMTSGIATTELTKRIVRVCVSHNSSGF